MSSAWVLAPDFLLIAAGFVLCRFTPLDRGVWDGVERLVYHVLFPVLLFNSVLRSPLQPGETLGLAAAGVGVALAGIALAALLRLWRGADRGLLASGAQTAFRFNSFIALALAERLAGAQGLAWIALLIALCVPLCNVAAVWPLARQGGQGIARELARNPLIIATLAGLAANLSGVRLPETLATTLQRIGLAALPMGLMAVGAGLKLVGLKEAPALAAALLAIRHVALPLVGIVLAAQLALPQAQAAIVVMFAALPTAPSAYVLAVRMGGQGPFVAGLVTLSTMLGALGVPLWLAASGAVPGPR